MLTGQAYNTVSYPFGRAPHFQRKFGGELRRHHLRQQQMVYGKETIFREVENIWTKEVNLVSNQNK